MCLRASIGPVCLCLRASIVPVCLCLRVSIVSVCLCLRASIVPVCLRASPACQGVSCGSYARGLLAVWTEKTAIILCETELNKAVGTVAAVQVRRPYPWMCFRHTRFARVADHARGGCELVHPANHVALHQGDPVHMPPQVGSAEVVVQQASGTQHSVRTGIPVRVWYQTISTLTGPGFMSLL